MTPEQMRALADKPEEFFARHQPESMRDFAAALRAAADQLEAVRRWADQTVDWAVRTNNQFDMGYNSAAGDVQAILTADTAPQEHHPACGALDEPCHCKERGDAPQEGRDAVYSGSVRSALFECAAVFPGDLLGPVMYCRKRRGHTGEHNADGMRWLR